MCVPAGALLTASLLIQAGSQIAEHEAQAQQARTNRREARRARLDETRVLGIRQVEEGRSASRARQEIRREASGMAGDVVASAASGGVEGGVVDALLAELAGSEGRALMDIQDQYVATIEQLQREKEGSFARERARVAGVTYPSILETGLRIGGDVTNYLANRERLNAEEDAAERALEDI